MTTPIDLRSDTVTRPTPAMREAMARAEVGDDVFDDDPTLHALQDRVAALLGKEAALFVVSGTMGNQLAVRSQVQHGQEVLLERECHIFNYEAGGAAAISGAQMNPLTGRARRARARAGRRRDPRSRLPQSADASPLPREHAQSRGRRGDPARPAEGDRARRAASRAARAPRRRAPVERVGRDGRAARPLGRAVRHRDDVLLEGIGRPGRFDPRRRSRGDPARAQPAQDVRRRHSQGGVLAAACLYALDHHVERLADDHRRARRLAELVQGAPGLSADPAKVDTNIVLFEITDPALTSEQAVARLRERGLWMVPFGPRTLRAIAHLDVDDAAIDRAGSLLRGLCAPAGQTV
jgi:threonine aldolase